MWSTLHAICKVDDSMLLLKHKSCKETKANLAVGCAKLLQILLTKKKKKM